jgi:glutathione S-transferase
MLELYHAGMTTCSRKARLGLKEKGVPYQSHYMNLGKFEHHTPEYLKINPNGIVPSLVHDGKIVIESGVINEYVDDVFPDRNPLRPADPHARAKMRVLAKMADEYALPATRVPTWTRTKQAQLKAMSEAEFDKVIRETPLVDHQIKMKALKGAGFTDKEVEESNGRMQFVYDRCEQALAEGGPWLVGEQFTLADIALLPYVDAFRGPRPELMGSHPRVKEWFERCMARPAVKATWEPSDEAPAPQARVA